MSDFKQSFTTPHPPPPPPSAYTECKHFLVDASSGRYHFVGPKQQDFATLTELLKFYRYTHTHTHSATETHKSLKLCCLNPVKRCRHTHTEPLKHTVKSA